MATRLILGCGYLGRRVAQRWLDAGDRVIAVTRSPERAAELADAGMRTIVDDVRSPSRELLRWAQGGIEEVDTALVAVGFDRSGDTKIEEVYTGAVRTGLSLSPIHLRRFIYISTTGVYGDAGGDWVDEQTEPDPQRDGAKASLAAERLLLSSPLGSRAVVLRLAGIYGPGRVPFLDLLREEKPIPAIETGWLNLIHVDDAASAVLAAADRNSPPQLVCVSDGDPPQRGDYYAEVARRIGAPAPTFTAPPADSPRAARAASDKRVRNALLADELGVALRYPSYREGLASILGD